jgi:hypothetical protein
MKFGISDILIRTGPDFTAEEDEIDFVLFNICAIHIKTDS